MNKIIVTGANGMLGKDLCPILEAGGYNVIKTDISEMDITDSHDVESKISAEKPAFVIHCAAYTNVDKAEEDLATARLVNTTGTKNIAKSCANNSCKLVYISTDYVFDGCGTKPYETNDPTNPINNYGLTKLEGELAVKRFCKEHYIARTSWLYGIHGNNFVETMLSLANKQELKVVDDQIGCPTWTVDLSKGILHIMKNKKYGTYHVCGSGYTSWHGFAREIFSQYNLNVNLTSCTTDEFPRPAKRPKYSVMNNDGICRDWQLALKDYLNLREGVKV